jgi:hypothetical protein
MFIWKFGIDYISLGTTLIKSGSYAIGKTKYGEIQLTILKITEKNVGSYTCYYRNPRNEEKPLITYNIILRGKSK